MPMEVIRAFQVVMEEVVAVTSAPNKHLKRGVMNLIATSALWLVLIAVAIVGLWVFAMIGVSFSTDVTDDKKLWGGYNPDNEYFLDRSVFIIKADKNAGGHLVLVPEESFKRCLGRHWSAPDTIDEYRADPVQASIKQYDGFEKKIDIVGIIEKGTILKPHRLEKTTGWNLWYGGAATITPFAKVIGGPFQGKLVDLTDVSIYYQANGEDGPFIYKPEQGLIRGTADPVAEIAVVNKCS